MSSSKAPHRHCCFLSPLKQPYCLPLSSCNAFLVSFPTQRCQDASPSRPAAPSDGGWAQVPGSFRSSPVEPRSTHERTRCRWCSHAAGSHPDDRNRLASFSPPYIENICFNCCRCSRGMLQVFRIDVVKVDQNITYVAMTIHVCCKCLF
jgi:hypothetical protein